MEFHYERMPLCVRHPYQTHKEISYEDDLIEASNSFLRYVRSN